MIDEGQLYKLLGERLRRLRDRQEGARGKMTQLELADLVGLERTSITNAEKGIQKVPLHALYRLCEVLRAQVSDVLPLISEVQKGKQEIPLVDIPFNGQRVAMPPLVAQAVSSRLQNIGAVETRDTDADAHG